MARVWLNCLTLALGGWLGSCSLNDNRAIGEELSDGFSVKQIKRIGTTRFRHGSMIGQLWFASDQRLVSSGGLRFRLFDAESGEFKSEVTHPRYSRATFDGDRRVLIADPRVNGVPTQGFRVVDINTGEQLSGWRHHTWANPSVLSRGGKIAVLGSSRAIFIVDAQTGRELDRIEGLPRTNRASFPRITLSEDSKLLAVVARPNLFQFFELTSAGKVGKSLATIDDKRFTKMVFSPSNDKALLIGNRNSAMYNTRTGKELAQWDEPDANPVSSVVFAGMGLQVAELADGIVRLRDTQSGKQLRSFPLHANPRCDEIALSPDETILAAGGYQGRVRLYDFETGQEIRFDAQRETHGPVEAVAISDNGQWIASAEYKGVVSLWNGADDWKRSVVRDDDIKSEHRYDTHAGPNFLTFLPGTTRLLAGSGMHHNSVNVWDAASGKRIKRFVGHGMPIVGVAASRDGQVLASHGRTTRIWNRSGEQLHQLPGSGILAMSADGRLLALNATARNADRRRPIPSGLDYLKVVELWSTKSGERVVTTSTGTKEPYGFRSLSFSHDGKYVAGIAQDGLYVWKTATGELTQMIPVTEPADEAAWHAPNCGCAFSPTENIIAVSRSDGAVVFLNVESKDNPQVAIAHGHNGPVHSVCWRRDGKQLVSGGIDSTIVLWQIERGEE